MRVPRATAVPRMLFLLYWLGLKSQGAFAPGAWSGLGPQGLPQQGRNQARSTMGPRGRARPLSLLSPPHFPSQSAFSCRPQTSPRVIQCLSSCSGRQTRLAFVSVPSFSKETSDAPGLGQGAHLSLTSWPGSHRHSPTLYPLLFLLLLSTASSDPLPGFPLRPSPAKEALGAEGAPATSPLPSLFTYHRDVFSCFHISQRRIRWWLTHAGARGLNPNGFFSPPGLLQAQRSMPLSPSPSTEWSPQ